MLWSGTPSQPDYQIPELLNKGVLPLAVCDIVHFSVCNRMTRSSMTAMKGKLCIAYLNVDEYEESLALILDHIYQPHLISIRTTGSMADLVHVLNNIAGRALGWTVQHLCIMVEPDDDDMDEVSKIVFFEGALMNCVLAVLSTSCLQVLRVCISSEAHPLHIDTLIPLTELVEKSSHLQAMEFISPGNLYQLRDLLLSMRSSGWDVVCSPLLQNEQICTNGRISAAWNRKVLAHGPDATREVNVQKKMEAQVEFEFLSWQQRLAEASHPIDLAIDLDCYILKVEASNREVPDVQSEAEERDNLFGLVKEFLRVLGLHQQNISDWAATLDHLLLEQSAQVRIALGRMLLRYSTITYLENVLVSAQCEEPLGYFQMLEVEMVLGLLVHSVTKFDSTDTSLDLAVLRLFAIHCWCVILRWLDKAEECNRILCDCFWPVLQRSPEAQPYWWSLMRTAQSQSILSRLPAGFDVPHKSQQKLLPKFMYTASRWIRNEFSESCSNVDFALHLDINERFAWEPRRNSIPCILACAVERSMVMAWQQWRRGPQGEAYESSHAVHGRKHTDMKFMQALQPMVESDMAGSDPSYPGHDPFSIWLQEYKHFDARTECRFLNGDGQMLDPPGFPQRVEVSPPDEPCTFSGASFTNPTTPDFGLASAAVWWPKRVRAQFLVPSWVPC